MVMLGSYVHAETILQLNGQTSYVKASHFDAAREGVFSVGIWVWPERMSSELEAVVSLATSNEKSSLTVGWVNGGFYYTDDLKEDPVLSERSVERMSWHYVVLTLEPVDRDVYFDTDATKPVHRLGKLYVDGDVSLSFETRLPDLNKAIVTVGVEYKRSKAGRFFTGLVDELRIYSTTLTADEVQTLPFIKPDSAIEAKALNLVYYSSFNDVDTTIDIQDKVVSVRDMVGDIETEIYYSEHVTAIVMPYDPILLSAFSRAKPFQNTLYAPLNLTGPLKGAGLTVTGSNFAKTAFLEVLVDGEPAGYTYMDVNTLEVHLPSKSIAVGQTEMVSVVSICNGGLPLPVSNCGNFTFKYQHVIGEDWSAQLTVFYKFDGDLINAADRTDRSMDATIAKDYGNGGPFYTNNREASPNQALLFVRGERVETPVLIGAKARWSLCAWIFPERDARTLFYERDESRQIVANLIQLDADGLLYLDGEPGAHLIFDSWQFMCIIKSEEKADFYTGGLLKASAVPVKTTGTLAKGLIGTNFTGLVDDFWVFDKVLTAYDVMLLYTNEDFAIELDGVNGAFVMTNSASDPKLFDSAKWSGNSLITIEVYVKAYNITGVQPLFYQSSLQGPAPPEEYDGVYLAIEDGEVLFYTQVADATGNKAQITRTVNPTSFTVKENEWYLIVATFDQNSATISVDGVPKPVNPGVAGSCTVSPCNTANRFGSLNILESSTKPISIGFMKNHGYFAGLIGEVRLWSKALTAEEIKAYYRCPPVPGDIDLYAYFKLDDASGSVYYSGSNPSIQMEFTGPKLPFWVASNYSSTEFTDATKFPNSEVHGLGISNGRIEDLNIFTFQARDGCARLRKFETLDMQLIVDGPLDKSNNIFEGEIAANGDGTYTGVYASTSCGFYSIRVESTDVPLPTAAVNGSSFYVFGGAYDQFMAKGAPFKAYLAPGPTVASLCYAYDAPDVLDNNDLKTAFYGVPASFALQTVDKYGCKRTAGGDQFDVFMTGRYNIEGQSEDHQDGTYTISYVPLIAGLAQLHVALEGMPVGAKGEDDPKTTCGVSLGSDFGGSPWLIDVQQGKGSLLFTGPESVELDSEEHLSLPGSEFTLESWVYPMAPYSDGRIISKESPYTGHGYWLGIHNRQVTTGLYVGGDEYRNLTSNERVEPDTWTHLAVTYDGRTLSIFVNGKLVNSTQFEEKKVIKENTQKLKVGLGFSGLIDEVRLAVYSKDSLALAAEISCPVANDTVVLYMMFNDGAGNVAFDYSSYSTPGKFAEGSTQPQWDARNAPYAVNQLNFQLSEISGDGLERARVGVASSFRMDLKDGCGFDYVVTDAVQINIGLDEIKTATSAHGEAVCPELTLGRLGDLEVFNEPSVVGTGEILVSYVPEKCGDAHVVVVVDGLSPVTSPFAVSVIASEKTASAASALADLVESVVAGLETSLTVTAYDKFTCQRTTGGDLFQVQLTRTSTSDDFIVGPDLGVSVNIQLIDHADGTYEVLFTAPAAGNYTLDVGYDEGFGDGMQKLKGSPHVFYATPAPWRSYLIPGKEPEARYNPTTAVYEDELYVIHGLGSDKSPLMDVWKYPLEPTKNTWSYRRLVMVKESNATQEVKIVVDTQQLINSGKMRADCADVMFLKVDSDAGGQPVGYFLDQFPGCNSKETGFWISSLKDESFELYLYYGNVHATSTQVDGKDVFTEYEDFETVSPFANGWELADTCSLPPGDETAFTNVMKDPVTGNYANAITGKKVLKVDAISKAGGSLMKKVKTLETYILKGFLYDTDALSSSHWFSPNFEDCAALPNNKLQLPTSTGLGVFTAASEAHMALLYPWAKTAFSRSCGWRAMEIVCNGTHTNYFVNGLYLGSKAPMPLTKIFIRGGAPSREGGQTFESIALWDTIFVAEFNPAVVIEIGGEEAVVFTTKEWEVVSTRGKSPPPRSTESAVVYEDKLFFASGFGSITADGLVWYYHFPASNWASITPWGSARPASREDSSLVLYNDALVVFGGRSGATLLSDLWLYNISENAWFALSTEKEGPSPRFAHSAAVHKDSLYVFGGDVSGGASSETWRYNFKMSMWMDLTPTYSPPSRFSGALAVQADSMYIHGGATMDTELTDTWKYDFYYNSWSRFHPENDLDETIRRSDLGFAVNHKNLYVFGGRGATGYLQDLKSLVVY